MSAPPPQPPETTSDPLDVHLDFVCQRLAAGKVIPFLGAGASLCGRPPGTDWLKDHYLPTGSELADYLAEGYPQIAAQSRDLSRISQYVDLFGGGEAVLFEKLRQAVRG